MSEPSTGTGDDALPSSPPMAGEEAEATPSVDTAGSEPGGRSSKRTAAIIGAAVVVVLAIVAVVVVLARPADPTYDDASRTRFLDACTSEGGEPVRSTCECLYDAIVEEIPYDRYEVVSEELELQRSKLGPDEPLDLPDDIQAMLDGCL